MGLPQLRTIDPDEEQHAPLKGTGNTELYVWWNVGLYSGQRIITNHRVNPFDADLGSKKFNDNLHLGTVTQGCYKSVLGLVQKVSARTKEQALRHTSRLLQVSLILEKPQHALNALKILRILMMTYEDISVEVSKGSVPFLEHDNEDAWDVVPSETSLPSALACVEYLLLTRLARNPPVKEAIGGVTYRLKEEVENLFQLEIIQVLNFVAWSQLEAMQLARTFVPLIRKGVFEEVIRFQAAKNNFQKVHLMVNVLDFVSREVECCKLLMGWRMSQLAWSSNFRFMNTIIGLLGAKAESMEKLAVSLPFQNLFTGLLGKAARHAFDRTRFVANRWPDLVTNWE